MTLILACPWQPRGELSRLERYLPKLRTLFSDIMIALPSMEELSVIGALQRLEVKHDYYEGWSGRHRAVGMALEQGADHVFYVDMDRLIRWVETRPDELAQVAQQITQTDMLIVGRTEAAYATHSRTLTDTERLTNTFFSHLMGRAIDFSAGARGLSRRAAEWVLAYSPGNALAMDVGWAVLVQRAGYTWNYMTADGLDWETADRYRAQAATASQQRELAKKQDGDAALWAFRVQVAQQITAYGLDALRRELPNPLSE